MALGSSRLFCLHCVCMFGLFALFVCIIFECFALLTTGRSDQNNTRIRTTLIMLLMLMLKLSMDSLINVVVMIMCKIYQNGSNID